MAADLPNNKPILVTGATGALGPCVVAHLLQCGYRVRCLVRSYPPPELFPATVEMVQGDLTDANSLPHALAGCGAVVHMAALLHLVNPPPERLPDYQRINVDATQRLVAAACAAGVQRVIYLSTIAVYGESHAGPLCEESPTLPTTPYGKSKLAGEAFVRSARNAGGEAIGVVLRLSAVYGCRIKGNYQRLLVSLARNRFIPLGDGSNARALIYEKDVASAVELALCHPAAPGMVFNVSDGQTHTVSSIIEAICGALGRKAPQFSLPLALVKPAVGAVEQVANLLGVKSPIRRATLEKYSEAIRIDSRRIQAELGFVPRYTLHEGWQEIVAALGLRKA